MLLKKLRRGIKNFVILLGCVVFLAHPLSSSIAFAQNPENDVMEFVERPGETNPYFHHEVKQMATHRRISCL